jgi:hypothetical protein
MFAGQGRFQAAPFSSEENGHEREALRYTHRNLFQFEYRRVSGAGLAG